MKLLSSLFLVLLAGCVPWPHLSNVTPGVTGTLPDKANEPMNVVASGEADPCLGDSSEFKATSEGFFYVAPIREFNGFLVVMGHRTYPWALCSKTGEGWRPIYQAREYTLGDTGPAFLVQLTCAPNGECRAEHIWDPSEELITQLEAKAKR